MTRFALIGAGWRAETFIRVAAALPGFAVTAVLTRDAGRSAMVRERGLTAVDNHDDLLATEPGFVVAAASPGATPGIVAELVRRDAPALLETPPAGADGLDALWALAADARLQVAEQYAFQPEHAARLAAVAEGLLGEPSHAAVSAAHGYHGVSLLRRYLSVGFEDAEVSARRFRAPILHGGPGRDGPPQAEDRFDADHTHATLRFGDRWGVFDFTDPQYFSWIRGDRTLVRGDRGEIDGKQARYLLDFATPVSLELTRRDTGHGGNLEGHAHRGITLGERWLYRNPFEGARLSDDELAIATCLARMSDYVTSGEPFYPLADALQDVHLADAIDRSARTGETVRTTRRAWAP